MKTKLLFIAAIVGLSFSACNQTEAKEKAGTDENTETIKVAERVYPVKVEKITVQTIEKTIEYSANLLANEEKYIASSTPGRIENIYVEVGDRVKTGQKLADLDKTQLEQALIQYKSLEVDYNRMDTLYRAGSISKQQFDQIKTQYDVLKSNIKFLKENLTLVAPYNAMVTGRYFENGEIFSGAPNTQAQKAAIVTLMQMDILKVAINVSEKYFPKLKKGMTASVYSDIYPNKEYIGKVDLIYPTIDPMTRTFKVELLISNNKDELRPGMFVRAELQFGEKKTTLVPSIAVLKQEGTNNRFVFIHENGKAKRIEVELGKRYDDKLEIISNEIKEGNDLIIVGQASLLDGYKVSVK